MDPDKKYDSFQRAIWPILWCAQIFGMFPIAGLRSPSPQRITFSWISLRTAYTAIYIFFSNFMLFFYMKSIIGVGVTAKNFVGFGFYICSFASYIYFLWLATKWKRVMIVWTGIEEIFLKYPYDGNRIPVVHQIRAMGVIFLAMGLVEHVLFLVNSVYNIFTEASVCKYNLPDTAKYYFLMQFSHIFQDIPYNVILGLAWTWINFCLTISWNFMDIFAILVSVGLAKRFEQINNRLRSVRGKSASEAYWQQVRLHYVQLCELVEHVEVYLSPVILISCTNDLYFICYQLLNVFNVLPYKINNVYFWYSLLYLILRTICLFLYTAEINDQSKKPLEILKTIPTFSWCVELDRFIHQTARESICLSGMRFFYLTRKLLLSMIATVVTYELVLMQLDYKSALDFHNSTTKIYSCDFSYKNFL